jgi:hypothetical protein
MEKYNKIASKQDYDKLLKSGMFWEIYPELSGEYDKDIISIWYNQKQNENKTEQEV